MTGSVTRAGQLPAGARRHDPAAASPPREGSWGRPGKQMPRITIPIADAPEPPLSGRVEISGWATGW
jgi:hypothetical protein